MQVKTFADWGIDVPLTGLSPEVDAPCPKCSHTRRKKNAKCLSVNRETGLWHCWHCGRSGSLEHGWKDDPDNERLAKAVQYLPPKPLAPPREKSDEERAWDHLMTTRHLSRAALEAEGVQIVRAWCMKCEEWRTAVAFPYEKNGVHVHTKYRDGLKHFWSDSHTERVLYGYDRVVGSDSTEPIIIVEGEFDAIVLRHAGFARAVSVPDGAPQPEDKNLALRFKFLDDEALIAAMKASPVILAVDADGPGERLEAELARRLGHGHCTRVVWPEGLKDAGDAYRELGAQGLRDIIAAAEPYPVEGHFEVADLVLTTDAWMDGGFPRGLSTGWTELDQLVKVVPGQLWLIHAMSTAGKSSWINAFILNLMERHGMVAGIFSPEWQPVALHAVALLETYIGKPFDQRITGAMSKEQYRDGMKWLQDHVMFVLPKDRTVANVLDRAREAVTRRGIEILVLDPWTEFTHDYGRSFDKLAYIERTVTDVRTFGEETGVLVILATHQAKPIREKDKKTGRWKNAPAGLYGSRDSSDFAGKADVAIELIRQQHDYVTVDVQKVRYRYLGRTGQRSFKFSHATGRYTPVSQEEMEQDFGTPEKANGALAKAVRREEEPEPVQQLGYGDDGKPVA